VTITKSSKYINTFPDTEPPTFMANSQTAARLKPVKLVMGMLTRCQVEVSTGRFTDAEPTPALSTRFTADELTIPDAVLNQNSMFTACVRSDA
jgi:hypothetical protein